jgi:trans-2,3-dihydro-3-hydroxyanthranilate isomerase
MRPCHVLRVFTRGDVGGNHLGVVNDMTGLDDAGMQQIATELGFSETIFIDWMEEGTPRVRIFTPALELPFAGHPLVGAAWTLASMGPGTVNEMICGVGTIPFRVDGEVAVVDTPLVEDVRPAPEGADVAAAVGIPEPVRAWWAMMPVPYLVLDLGSAEAVAGATPDISKLIALRAGMTYLVGSHGDDLRARFFAPDAGVPEDPATGSAASAWAAVRSFEGETEGAVTIHQGEEIGHPSTIRLEWGPGRATLGGSVRRDEVRILER